MCPTGCHRCEKQINGRKDYRSLPEEQKERDDSNFKAEDLVMLSTLNWRREYKANGEKSDHPL